jgi:hypothetical protein
MALKRAGVEACIAALTLLAERHGYSGDRESEIETAACARFLTEELAAGRLLK